MCLLFILGIFKEFKWAPIITWIAIGVLLELDLRFRK